MVSITYKEPLDFFPSRSGIPARITATEIAELEVERTKFLSTASIDVHHPAYDRSAKPLLSFPALDDNGVDYDLLIHACYLLVNNAWPRDGRANDSTPYLSYSIHPRDKNPGHVIVRSTEGDTIVRGRCYLHVPGSFAR
ncbi:hypothetical protein GGR53DRAFT_373856 [Hypoxylon sp. FL1150]|nr:hypothetical protein GGR53DRAFT_373856 [Hypoxylon sp. FL1150]